MEQMRSPDMMVFVVAPLHANPVQLLLPPWDYQVFPEMGGVASHLQQATAKLRDTEAREDLKTQANMYNNTLTAQFALRT
jgi:hypothetical protein